MERTVEGHGGAEPAAGTIERSSTGLRIVLTVLFAIIWSVLEAVLALVVVFGLIWMLVTREAPPSRLRALSNQLVVYTYRIWRYLTQNEARVPFPFSDFPEPWERPDDLGRDEAREVRRTGGPSGGSPD